MNYRTIVEFNHDYAARVADWQDDFVTLLGGVLRTGDQKHWEALGMFGVKRLAQCHHSDEREVLINGRPSLSPEGRSSDA
jgi:hypothetical protein